MIYLILAIPTPRQYDTSLSPCLYSDVSVFCFFALGLTPKKLANKSADACDTSGLRFFPGDFLALPADLGDLAGAEAAVASEEEAAAFFAEYSAISFW